MCVVTRLSMPGRGGGGVDGAVELPRAQRIHRIQAREQPAAGQDLALGMADAPPGAQPLQHTGLSMA